MVGTVALQPDYELTPPEPKPPRKRTRDTSCMGYELQDSENRLATVSRWLSHYWHRHQVSPTSGELAHFARVRHADEPAVAGRERLYTLMYVRRGLSEGAAKNILETVPQGMRSCGVCKTPQETWRVRERGT